MVTSGSQDLIPWWSFTKTVIAVLVLRLHERGRLDIDRPVAGQPFRPAQLLRHEAGLPDYGGLAAYHADVAAGRDPWPRDRLRQAAAADRLLFVPGHGWAYSNLGYLLLAELVEAAVDQPLSDALRELLVDTAGLSSARLAQSRQDLLDVNMGDVAGYHPGWVYHGLIVGTAADAARLLDRVFRGDLLKADTLKRMCGPIPLAPFRTERHPHPGYGMGLMLSSVDTVNCPAGHSGSGPGSDIAVYHRPGTACAVWAAPSSGVSAEGKVFRMLEIGTGDQTPQQGCQTNRASVKWDI